ncbi:follistatin-related protein 5-like [Oppia nitens]|uniref:follistatin-related protein 5-like n=1 Tax=Oppia nitens TaxID=1686743 RepID=UPI0023DB496D|nr:follistatin-related protein 5-like [Oppia nitens]
MNPCALTSLLLIVVVVLSSVLIDFSHQSKHHRYSCPVVQKCPIHKHKVCGTDGKLYDSRCHLRKIACETGKAVRAAHPDRCTTSIDDDDDDDGDRDVVVMDSTDINNNHNNKINDDNTDTAGTYTTPQAPAPLVDDDSLLNNNEDNTYNNNNNNGADDDCLPKQYDLMKQQLLQKTNDLSLLFTHLDDDGDGEININELWRHSNIYKPADTSSTCILTELLVHEDSNRDENLDFSEFQNAFNKLYSVTMVTLDQSLAINHVQAHVGDNVEIRCDIVGEPQPPAIKWTRNDVDLNNVNVGNIKVFSDGSLYLTNVQLSFSGNYTCQAINNPMVKQVHVLHTSIAPLVEVSPRFQWEPIGGMATIECRYETFEPDITIEWYKNEELLLSNQRTTIMNNGTRVQLGQLERTDTGAYTCRVSDRHDTSNGMDVASLLIQDEAVSVQVVATDGSSSGGGSGGQQQERLWVFHGNGVSIYNGGCDGLLHELDGRDIIPQSGLTLCGATDSDQLVICEWSENSVAVNGRVYVGQPNLNRIVVFHGQQLNVVQVIATDPQPVRLWSVDNGLDDHQIWVLCSGTNPTMKATGDMSSATGDGIVDEDTNSFGEFEATGSRKSLTDTLEFEWQYPSQRQQQHNRKTVQVIRLSSNVHQPNVVHLQPIDGHFDLVYNMFVPTFSPQRLHLRHGIANRYAHVTHWDERAVIKIDMSQLKYVKTINLADCQPINGVHTDHGLLILQCQTPVTHQLNGQLVVDQITDALISYNPHVRAQRSYLSPNQHFLVNVLHNASTPTPATTIIVQRVVTDGGDGGQSTGSGGLEFLYDVRTSLNIVNCAFVWRNGNYDAVLASGTANREDLLYLSLSDGRVELITGIGRPTNGSHRGMALANKSRLLAVTATESVYLVDLNTNRIQCETTQRHRKPTTMIWS